MNQSQHIKGSLPGSGRGLNHQPLPARHIAVMLQQRRSAGMSMLGWLITICLFAFFVSVGLKLIPHYMDYSAIQKVIEQVPAEVRKSANKKKINELVDKRLKINSIRHLKSADILQVKRSSKGGGTVALDYEVREPLFGNIEAVLVFKKQY